MYTKFENEILILAKRIISEFDSKNIIINGPQIKKESSVDSNSELEISFSDNNGVFDVLEFFVYYKGKENVGLNEVEEWLKKNISDILEKK